MRAGAIRTGSRAGRSRRPRCPDRPRGRGRPRPARAARRPRADRHRSSRAPRPMSARKAPPRSSTRRAAHPKRHPRPMTSASPPTTRKAQPSGATPIDPVSKRRICPNESVPGPAGAMPANPDQSAPGRATPRAHGTLSTKATATPPTATPSARNDRGLRRRGCASTMQSATPSTSGDERRERHHDREHEAQPEHLALPSGLFRARERSQPARARQPADDPRHDGVGHQAVEAPVASARCMATGSPRTRRAKRCGAAPTRAAG